MHQLLDGLSSGALAANNESIILQSSFINKKSLTLESIT
jgi:hypothetical protein